MTDPAASLPPPQGSQVPYGITATINTHNSDGSITFQKLGQIPRALVGRMKINQLATQNGPDRGFLQAGPQGIYVPGFYDNFCALKAMMGYRYAGGGGWTEDWRPAGPNCPEPWALDQVNPNLTWLRDSAGIYGARGSGSYELCGRGCHTYGGYTTFIFTPTTTVVAVAAVQGAADPPFDPTSDTVAHSASQRAATTTMSASASASASGGGGFLEGSNVRFTASRVDGAVVTRVENWVWTPRNPNEPVQTVACATTSTTCETRVFEDGWMFAQVLIDGYIHTAYAGIVVQLATVTVTASTTDPTYSDPVTYTATPDPANVFAFAIKGWRFDPDNQALPDTTPSCPNATCSMAAGVSGTMWAIATMAGRTDSGSVHITVHDPTLTVSCRDAPTFRDSILTRGATVNCRAWVSRPVPFTIERREASGNSWSAATRPGLARPANDTVSWVGPAVTTTNVTVQARLSYGPLITGRGAFTVNARVWGPWRLTTPPIVIRGIRLGMRVNSPDTLIFATFQPRNFARNSVRIGRAMTGPDSSLAYVLAPPDLGGSDIYYHPDIFAGRPWYEDQDGKGGGTCRRTHITQQLHPWLQRHEGQTQQDSSHYGVANRAFAQLRPQDVIEALYSQTMSTTQLAREVRTEFHNWIHGPQMDMQEAFDGRDPVPGFGCTWDVNLRDP